MHPATSLTVLVLSLSVHQGVCAPRGVDSASEDVQLRLRPDGHETGVVPGVQVQVQNEHQYPLDALYPALPSFEHPLDDKDTYIDTHTEEYQEGTITTPTRYHSTLLARRLLALSSTATLTTLFPRNISSIPAYSRTPPAVAGITIGLPEYIADCDDTGDITIIALGVSTSTKNVEYADGDADHEGSGKGRNVSVSVSWWDQYSKLTHHEPWSMANLPRLSLLGYMQDIPHEEVVEKKIEECFVRRHGDSRLWLPGRKESAHQGKWARVVVEEVYWIGGFGGVNYIGWLSPGEWRGVGREEWRGVRLRGEKE